MGETLRLLVGPRGPGLVDRMIAEFPPGGKGLWIAPTALARARIERLLAWTGRGPSPASVWTWDELWKAVRERRGEGPIALSHAATRTVRDAAIDSARREDRWGDLRDAFAAPGFRRRLRSRIAAWTRSGRSPEEPPEFASPSAEAEWAIFASYRRLLKRLHAEDDDGLARWAAKVLIADPPHGFDRPARVRVVEPLESAPVVMAIDGLRRHARDMAVSLVIDSEPREVADLGRPALRDRLIGWGFSEEVADSGPIRGEALNHLTSGLFREPRAEPISRADGVTLLGAPEGEGEAIVTARRVVDLLGAGLPPEEVLIVSGRSAEAIEPLHAALRRCGIPAALSCTRSLTKAPAVVALLLAARLGAEGFEAETFIRLLRHGCVRPAWPEARDSLALARAATALREARAYRGASAIRSALRRHSISSAAADGDPGERARRRRSERAALALPLVERFIAAIDGAARPGVWGRCADRLFTLAEAIGLGEDASIDALRLSVEEQGDVLARLGRGREEWAWDRFVEEVAGLCAELEVPRDREPHGVSLACIDEVRGASARHVLIVGMGEGAFPAPVSEASPDGADDHLKREMERFLRLIDSADEGLTLVYPTTDVKGQALLASGFLDDVRRLFSPSALAAMTRSRSRIDPVLPEDLAIAAPERRIRAVARACLHGELAPLRHLARSAEHRRSLEGAARALRLAHWRTRRARFGRFDGRLIDPRIGERLARDFGPGRRSFSPSQLESMALCPFQFYTRYVLGLEPAEERREFDDDHAARGSLLHRSLQYLHEQVRDLAEGDDRAPADRVAGAIEGVFDRVIQAERPPDNAIERGLFAIEAERLKRTARRYARQFRAYAEKDGRDSECRHVEIGFGANASSPGLALGGPEDGIRIEGIIDRIDMADSDGQAVFRVIDYKSGHVPEASEVRQGIALQLPLYVLAAERVLLHDQGALPVDAAYWGLRDKGFKASGSIAKGDIREAIEGWRQFSSELERYVTALVGRLRRGDFPVRPRVDECDRRCDYRFVCRIKQGRRAEKVWNDAPSLGDSP